MTIPTGSRYEQAEHNVAFNHVYTERGFPYLAGEIGMTSLRVTVLAREALYRMTTEPDPVGTVQEYYAKEAENFQFLGFKILSDPRRWTELADLNPHVWYPLDMKPGQYMRVPVL